ncbi:MAG: hypothetical protein V1802_02145 [Candidatus Aenigmatarchaeota archaeon]
MDKIKELDERLTRIENKQKSTMFEIEKRLVQLESMDIEKRIEKRLQELEDVLMLIQLENKKLKEFSELPVGQPSPVPQNINRRLDEIEERLSSIKMLVEMKKIENLENFLSKEITEIDRRISGLEDAVYHKHTPHIHEVGKTGLIKELEKILND